MGTIPDMFDPDTEIDPGMWLRAAQGAVRDYCGWHVCPSLTRTLRVDGFGGRTLALPTLHLTKLTSVRYDGVEHVQDAAWSEAGVLRLKTGCFPDEPGAVEVTMTDGYDPEDVPQIMALLVTLSKRAQIQPGIASQTINGASVSYTTGATPGVALMQSEKDLLAPYRLGARP